jgi:hypothetical protein
MSTASASTAGRRHIAADGARGWSLSSTRSLIAVVWITAVVINQSVPTVNACSMPRGWRPRTPVEILLDATDVLYATVVRTVPDPRFNYGDATSVYSAEIDVHCILKGQRTNRRVNITQAGHVPGLCHSTNLTIGHRYVLAVRLDDNDYTTTSSQLNSDTDDQLGQLTVACNLTQQYPTGVDESTASVKCPTLSPPGECKSKQDFEAAGSREDDKDDDGDYYDDSKPTIRVGEKKDQSNARSSSCHWSPSTTALSVTLACWTAFVVKFG